MNYVFVFLNSKCFMLVFSLILIIFFNKNKFHGNNIK